MAFLHSAQLIYTDCGYPRWSVCFTLPNAIFFYMLFNDFYNKSYKGNKSSKTSKENEKLLNGHANGHLKTETVKNGDINHNETLTTESKKAN